MTESKRGRRRNGEGSFDARADGRKELKISLPGGGRKSFYGKTDAEARRKMEAWKRDQERGLVDASAKLTVGAFLDSWLEGTAKERVKATTLESYTGHVKSHLKPHLGKVKLRELNALHVNVMLGKLVDSGLSGTTANLVRATLRTALESAIRWGYVTQNAAKLAEPRKVWKEPVEPLELEETQRFIERVWSDRMGMLFVAAIYTGMRQGELLGLRWEEVDLDRGELRVRYQLNAVDEQVSVAVPKTARSRRRIALGETMREVLIEQRRRLEEWEMLAGQRWTDYDLVFPNTIGKPENASNVTHRLQVKLAEIGLPRKRFHDLRHTAASTLIAAGGDIHTVKELLGHSQISLTSNTYAHLTERLATMTAARMDAALGARRADDNSDDSFDDKSDDTEANETDDLERIAS